MTLRALTLLLLTGCTVATRIAPLRFAAAGSTVPKDGWWKIVTPDLELFTDLPPGEAREAAQELTAELIAQRTALGNPPRRGEQTLRVIVLANSADFERAFGRTIEGLTWMRGSQITVYLYGKPETWSPRSLAMAQLGSASNLRHELAHVQLDRAFGRQPRWLAEGFAQYLETLRWSDTGDAIEIGAINAHAIQEYFRFRSVGFTEAVTWGAPDFSGHEAVEGSMYGYTWALVFDLINERPQAFGRYLSELARGTPPPPQTLYDGEDPAHIDQRVQLFMKSGSFAKLSLPVKVQAADAQLAPASGTERAAVQAELDAFAKKP